MKDIHWLYSISIFAMIGVLVCLIGYATYTLSSHTPKQHAPETTPTPTGITETFVKKQKNCGCCTERIKELRIKLQKAREVREARKRQQAAQHTSTTTNEAMPPAPAGSEKTVGSAP